MDELLRENAHGPCSREQLLVELIDWCHSLTVAETDAEATLLAGTTSRIEAERFVTSLDARREGIREFLTSLQKRLENAGGCLERHVRNLEQELGVEREQNGLLIAARDALMTSLTQAESRLAEMQERLAELQQHQAAPRHGETCGDAEEDSERRYQMALEDIRQEKAKNAELQQQLAKLRTSPGKSSREPGWLDWEAEKLRIVAALEADSDEMDEAKKTERLGIEEVLRMTDEVIASKDREIRELRRQLNEQSHVLATSAVVATEPSPASEILDNDAVIQEERERLQQLQKEWRDKLRQAEVDISLERAKIARERADLDEQIRLLKDALPPSHDATDSAAPVARSAHGRWLAKLGLTAADREPSRHP